METKYSNEDATSQVQLEFFQIIENADNYRVIKSNLIKAEIFIITIITKISIIEPKTKICFEETSFWYQTL